MVKRVNLFFQVKNETQVRRHSVNAIIIDVTCHMLQLRSLLLQLERNEIEDGKFTN